jgi:hypothetical protein
MMFLLIKLKLLLVRFFYLMEALCFIFLNNLKIFEVCVEYAEGSRVLDWAPCS